MNPIKDWKRGDKAYHPTGGVVEIMAVADNYIMARRKGASPFIMSFMTATEAFLKHSQKEQNQ